MCETGLWGNATDLSLLTFLTIEDRLGGSKVSKDDIITNDLSAAYDVLGVALTANKIERHINIILSDAGFEIFVYLVLTEYLLAFGLETKVIRYPKAMPWFSSDAMHKDMENLLATIANSQRFYDTLDFKIVENQRA
ncbi:MAG: hypothetical protein M1834_006422 [Cirrosporium novae-zelandiae]|nr:MAG: hypothetical protein M1834_006422 [Cirrosporium novae-zelandiae]